MLYVKPKINKKYKNRNPYAIKYTDLSHCFLAKNVNIRMIPALILARVPSPRFLFKKVQHEQLSPVF